MCRCVEEVLALYGLHFKDLGLYKGDASLMAEKRGGFVRMQQPRDELALADNRIWRYVSKGVRCSFLEDNKLVVNFNMEQLCPENSNDEVIEDIRKSFVEHKLIADGEQPTPLSSQGSSSGGGCYVATAVYGSYDCPQVWTLRRYRDHHLANSLLGKAFIKTYYAISPTVVRLFGDASWFNHFWRSKLDRMVSRLNESGYEDTPYKD